MVGHKDVLLCVVGTSPAVLTETVWALARRLGVRLREVVVLTTATGWATVQALKANGAWKRLCEAIDYEPALRRAVFQNKAAEDLEDLRGKEENLLAADQMLRTVRSFTEEPETRVFASIAGGRKTMSALFFSCMSLLGRGQDRVLHVLASPDWERGGKFFPQNAEEEEEAAIELFEVPFVRMRTLYADHFAKAPPNYEALVCDVEAQIAPRLAVNVDAGTLTVNGEEVHLAPFSFLCLVLAWQGRYDKPALIEACERCLKAAGREMAGWLGKLSYNACTLVETLPKRQTDVRKALRRVLPEARVKELLPTNHGKPTLPPNVTWVCKTTHAFFKDCGLDIRGYPKASALK